MNIHGLLYAFLAFGIWGFVPIYWKQLAAFSSLELFAHRVWWAALVLVVLFTFSLRWREVFSHLLRPKTLALMAVTSFLIMLNWYIFVYAVQIDHIIEASLGYFLNPLLSIVMGVVLLKEKLRPLQWVAVGFALIGVLVFLTPLFFPSLSSVEFNQKSSLLFSLGISLSLALSFAIYGLLRKLMNIPSEIGLFGEVLLAFFPLSLVIYLSPEPLLFFKSSPSMIFLVFLAGPLTLLPLFFFNKAVRLLKLSTVGIIQYMTPTLQLIGAVWLFGETFHQLHLLTFSCVWIGLILYTMDGLKQSHGRRVEKKKQSMLK